GDVIQRADDQPEAIRQRLAMYERDTAPLLAFYEERGLLVRVDGSRDADQVTAAIVGAVHERGLG
ncbi:MAG TPA: adenylate kinase, partial [Acidimicrobiales bacterium]|nr:adenylate kinase [Acidimicrobiales bacterium]